MTLLRSRPLLLLSVTLPLFLLMQGSGFCAETDLHHMSEELGKTLEVYWVVPFVCMLLSIAICPLAVPHFWHRHFGKVAVFWGLAFLLPFGFVHGAPMAFYQFVHAILLEYVPFIILLFALFTVSGGIRLKGSLAGTPVVNTVILIIGTVLASWMGTTGAAMLLIRPLLRANAHRRYHVHTVVFFIFLVANIGGSLTPLGDPPLFLGFLKGVKFFWTLEHLFTIMNFAAAFLLVLYFIMETILYAKEGKPAGPAAAKGEKLGLEGLVNFPLLACIVGAVLMSGTWQPDVKFTVYHVELELQNIVRDVLLLCIAWLSLKITRKETRTLNDFNWGPIEEVAKLFLGIFLSMIPALAILRAGTEGNLSNIIALVSTNGEPDNAMFFWLTGTLSSFLDNAPTYLVFFSTAAGIAPPDAVPVVAHLMTDMAPTLMAISAGAVFMGANTYIGNAPNFMVRSISEDMGVSMPSFFGYMLWSGCILIPLFILCTFVFF